MHVTTRRRTQRVVRALRAGSLATVVAWAVAGGLEGGTPSAGPDPAPLPGATGTVQSTSLARAVGTHDCPTTGADRGARATSALIRTEQGEVREVSFERAWDVYTGQRPGTLIAVCLND
jgi:hypothetical protein